jgi:hypothetical protein
MEGLTNVLLILALFFLRLGVPILVTVAIGYGLCKLDAKWRSEAEREARGEAGVRTDEIMPQLAGQPMAIRLPEAVPASMFAVAGGAPCWDVKGCSEAMRANCAAFRQPAVPCWQARTQAEGRLPAPCKSCHLYSPVMVPTRPGQQPMVH